MGFCKVSIEKTFRNLVTSVLITWVLLLAFATENGSARGTCKIGEFRCESGECIPKDQVCDSIRDCPSGIDEYVCTPKFRRGLCGHHRVRYQAHTGLGDLGQNVISYLLGGGPKRPGIFQCQFGGCIPLNRICDGAVNCIGGSDEGEICENNSCLPGQFRCKYGACIPDWQMCNGRMNCPDGSDETPEACKHITCKSSEFRCRYGGCIPKERICDIKRHCADGSDEYDFLCLITRAKMVERWGMEGKQINDEQEQRFLALAEKEKKRKENSATEKASPQPDPITTTTTTPVVSDNRPIISDDGIPKITNDSDDGQSATTQSNVTTEPTKLPLPVDIDAGVKSEALSSTTSADESEGSRSPPPPTVSTTEEIVKECLLPGIPDNADATITSCLRYPNAYYCQDSSRTVPVGAVVQYECGAGFLLYGVQAITCLSSGNWSARPPECDPLIDVRFGFGSALPNNFDPRCPPLNPPRGVRVECIDQKSENVAVKPCSEKQTPGTDARFTCAPYYRPSTDLPTHYEKCGDNGEWIPGTHTEQFTCVPDCGLSEVPKTPYILNGISTKRGQWPWHVAIYLKIKGEFKYICGGALITEHAVLTSAHCVTVRGQARNSSELLVLLGKQNIDLPDPDPFVQKRTVLKIFIEDSFNHIALDSDVAILALKAPAVLSFYVRPVCYPQTSNSFLEEYQLAPGNLGTVVGFGFNENGTLSHELKMTQLPVVSAAECANSHGDFFASMTRSTNYCAGYQNGTQVCNGDSGGGQYFRAVVRGSTRWYIQGLVSYGVPDSKAGSCSSSQYAIFTRVGRYGDWIVRTLSKESLI